jgi:ABC-type Fe3+/spermidine/putrescine transport system ATPase subunit
MSDSLALSLNGVFKSFGKTAILKGVSLDVRKGEFISLLGPSGCGKTTTLNLIAGFSKPDAGDILIGGQCVNDVPSHHRHLGMVFQGHALFPHMNCFDNVAFGLRMRKIADSEIRLRVGEALELVRLSGMEKRFPRELSGGQQQRVGLARALAVKPEILLLDEPLSNLDAKLRKAMQSELRAIHTKVRATMIYVTHDQEEALTLSNRIAVMNDGHLEQLDTPEEIYLRPRTRFVADFIGSSNFLRGTVMECRPGSVVAKLETGESMLVSTGKNLPVGSEIQLGVRSDRILVLSADAPVRQGVLSGKVLDRVFAGSQFQILVEVASGQRISVHLTETPSADVVSGAPVLLEIAPSNWMILQ